jgi:lysozyme C
MAIIRTFMVFFSELRTDDITRASACAKLIYERYGFSAWNGWVNKCNGKPLPSLNGC